MSTISRNLPPRQIIALETHSKSNVSIKEQVQNTSHTLSTIKQDVKRQINECKNDSQRVNKIKHAYLSALKLYQQHTNHLDSSDSIKQVQHDNSNYDPFDNNLFLKLRTEKEYIRIFEEITKNNTVNDKWYSTDALQFRDFIIKYQPTHITNISQNSSITPPKDKCKTKYYPDGSIYDGQIKNDKREGIGTLTTADGMTYKGLWKKDQLNDQQGFISYSDKSSYIGMIIDIVNL